jgi:hypothetical protein
MASVDELSKRGFAAGPMAEGVWRRSRATCPSCLQMVALLRPIKTRSHSRWRHATVAGSAAAPRNASVMARREASLRPALSGRRPSTTVRGRVGRWTLGGWG